MCGITGIMAFNLIGNVHKINITAATQALAKRGPDHQAIYTDERVGLGHRRLSVIDTTDAAHQPMWDASGRYAIVFNGEIFNFRELRQELQGKGVTFNSQSDTEVLLHLLIREGAAALSRLNGFFAFCLYDKVEQSFLLARDRYGIKPLLYLVDEDKFLFASELKSLLSYGIDKTIDRVSLYSYLQLNYIPGPDSIFTHVKKMRPGHYAVLKNRVLTEQPYYEIPPEPAAAPGYEDAKAKLAQLLEAAVQRRLIADVPLGAFLSGGIDSSVVATLASRHQPHLHTFSIGYRDEKFFDETEYARLVAKKIGTEHTVFSLTNQDLYSHLYQILDYIDEPFADSSAIAVYILSKETRRHATVGLSGDGADELLAGYNKHAAFYRLQHPSAIDHVALALAPVLRAWPQSRHGFVSNKIRQLVRFADGAKRSLPDRYFRWAAFADEAEAATLLLPSPDEATVFRERKATWLRALRPTSGMNDILRADMQLVLANDMLTKVDSMSMANSLEVRVPFLDVEVVNFVFSLPESYKINRNIRKRILQDAFRDVLPPELYNRPKKGFEVPLLKWLRTEMRSLIVDDLLNEERIRSQGIFRWEAVQALTRQLFSSNPGDVHARIWAMVVFQWWWKKYHTAN
jgi:asparagine synthase (glutamine-hydrolysing)